MNARLKLKQIWPRSYFNYASVLQHHPSPPVISLPPPPPPATMSVKQQMFNTNSWFDCTESYDFPVFKWFIFCVTCLAAVTVLSYLYSYFLAISCVCYIVIIDFTFCAYCNSWIVSLEFPLYCRVMCVSSHTRHSMYVYLSLTKCEPFFCNRVDNGHHT